MTIEPGDSAYFNLEREYDLLLEELAMSQDKVNLISSRVQTIAKIIFELSLCIHEAKATEYPHKPYLDRMSCLAQDALALTRPG